MTSKIEYPGAIPRVYSHCRMIVLIGLSYEFPLEFLPQLPYFENIQYVITLAYEYRF